MLFERGVLGPRRIGLADITSIRFGGVLPDTAEKYYIAKLCRASHQWLTTSKCQMHLRQGRSQSVMRSRSNLFARLI
jgi:hypothetical protein